MVQFESVFGVSVVGLIVAILWRLLHISAVVQFHSVFGASVVKVIVASGESFTDSQWFNSKVFLAQELSGLYIVAIVERALSVVVQPESVSGASVI